MILNELGMVSPETKESGSAVSSRRLVINNLQLKIFERRIYENI